MKHLRITLMAGLILLIISAGVLTIFYLVERGGFASIRQQDSFNRILREFDAAFEDLYLTEREIDRLNGELDKLEKRAISVESWLSILKRRRAIVSVHPSSIVHYRNSIESALQIYPSSQPIAAIAAAALIKNTAINRDTEEQLRDWLPLITGSPFNTLRLGLHVLLGDFGSPKRAEVLPVTLFSDGSEDIGINLAILKILRSDIRGAAADIHALINSPDYSAKALRFAAEYHYDFGDLQRSAELFSYIVNDEYAMIRQADALYLGGYIDMAFAIWNILADSSNETSLYNLSVVTDDREQKTAFLNRLVNLDTSSNSNSRQFGLIRYSRMLDNYSAALQLLRNTVTFSPEDYPYIDLEISKRHVQGQNLGRQIAETWLLLDRHEKNEEIYRWAAWHFFFQRDYNEARILMDRLFILQLSAPWIDVYRALRYMNEGNLDIAENILRSIPEQDAPWYVNANLGRILESARSRGQAIEQYQLAMSKMISAQYNPKTAARLQVQAGKCFLAANRTGDARRAFRYALELDPDSISAQMELDRLN